MMFLIGVGSITLFMLGMAVWAVRADKKDKEQAAGQHKAQ